MPPTPKIHDGVVVRHASDHVLGRVNAIHQRPETEKAPWDEKLEPNVLQVEETQHTKLGWCVLGPIGSGMEDGDHVHVMNHDFHGEQDNNETNKVEGGSLGSDAVRFVSALSDVVIESNDGPSEVERRVHGIGEVVAERIISRFSGYSDSVPLGEIGRVELFLLDVISHIELR